MDLLHAKQSSFKKKVTASLDLIQSCASNKVYVAVSGGKDSTVLLDLVRRVIPTSPAVFSDDEWMFPETDEYLSSLQGLTRIAAPAKHSYFFTSNKTQKSGVKWIVGAMNNAMQAYAAQHGYDCAMIGLRKDESQKRRAHINAFGQIFRAKSGIIQCYPLAEWTTDDIWAYIRSRNISYNKAYDKMESMSVPRKEQRVGPFAVDAVLGYGQLVLIKKGWPDLYNKFAAKFPEVREWS